ncbi:MAG: hypothetical protein AAF125_06435 [Chloroflexota bacterium]
MRRLSQYTLLLLLLAAAACAPIATPIAELPTLAVLPTETVTPTPSVTPTAAPATPVLMETGPAVDIATAAASPTATVTVTPSATITDTVTPTPSDTPTPTETLPPLEGINGLAFLAARSTPDTSFIAPGTSAPRVREIILTSAPITAVARSSGGIGSNAIPSPGDFPGNPTPTPLGGSTTVNCPNTAPGTIGAVVASNTSITGTLGCPLGSPPTLSSAASAYQAYQGGFMIWVDSPTSNGTIYAFSVSGEYLSYPDTWTSGVDPERGGETPPDGLIEPIRGFGKVWRDNPIVRNTLGWATGTELGGTAEVVLFENGQAILLPQTRQVLALTLSGQYNAYPG